MKTILRGIFAFITLCLAPGCSSKGPTREVLLDRQPIATGKLTVAEVARAVVVTNRENDILYRGPTVQVVDRAQLVVNGQDLGSVQQARAGFLFGVRHRDTGRIQNFLSFQSDLIEGTNRFREVTLADGRPLRFTVAAATPDPCVPPCFLVLETLIAELSNDMLRNAPASGIALSIWLDNGRTVPVVIPTAYIDGYLTAIDAGH